MRFPAAPGPGPVSEAGTFLACLQAVLALDPARLPELSPDEDPARGGTVSRWLGGLGLGIARISDPPTFSWAGPWIARVRSPGSEQSRFVVMYGVPSGVVWDPAGEDEIDHSALQEGYLIAAADIALALPPRPSLPTGAGAVESIWISPAAGERAHTRHSARALSGRGLEGDRHVTGKGTFPSGLPGSALTLLEAEVCESFTPPLKPDEHRRNVITRGVALNRLVGHEFTVGEVHCRGMRLCEPCTVVQRYAGRPILRALVHRGGLRADILQDGVFSVGDPVRAVDPGASALGG